MLQIAESAWNQLRAVVFPPLCLACDEPLGGGDESLCADCAAALATECTGDYCRVCGGEPGPHLMAEWRCPECRAARPGYRALFRVGRYRAMPRQLILRFKYARIPILDALLGDLMHSAVAADSAALPADAVVPVPSPWRRTWQRGFQPTRLLADRIGMRLRRPRLDALRLARRIRPQKELTLGERTANVADAIAVRDNAPITGKRLLLVDDVCTSGATLREAARVLRRGGAATVDAVVFAVAKPGDDRIMHGLSDRPM